MNDINVQIVNWVQFDNKLKEYNEKCKLLREKKEEISNHILTNFKDEENRDNFPQFAIEQLNTKIMIHQSIHYESFNNKFLLESFSEYFQGNENSSEKAEELLKFLKQRRKKEMKIILKRDTLN